MQLETTHIHSSFLSLQCAAVKLNEDCVKFLLKHGGANPWVISSRGQTLIHLAAFSTFVQLMEIRERVSTQLAG